jgi:hypothetical protein
MANIRLFIVVIVYRYRLIVVHQIKEKLIILRLCSWSCFYLLLAHFQACVLVVPFCFCSCCLHDILCFSILRIFIYSLYYSEEQKRNWNWNYRWYKLFKYEEKFKWKIYFSLLNRQQSFRMKKILMLMYLQLWHR